MKDLLGEVLSFGGSAGVEVVVEASQGGGAGLRIDKLEVFASRTEGRLESSSRGGAPVLTTLAALPDVGGADAWVSVVA